MLIFITMTAASVSAKWKTVTHTDEFEGTATTSMHSYSQKTAQRLEFPYTNAKAFLKYRCEDKRFVLHSKVNNYTDTITHSKYNTVNMRAKIDGRIISTDGSQFWGSNFVMLNAGITQDLLNAKEVIFKIPHYEQSVTWKFDMSGLDKELNNCQKGKTNGLETKWHKNGKKRSEINYKDGKKHGLSTEWHENGQKKSEINYKNGKEHGLLTLWHENGQKNFEENYKNGKEHGLVTSWNKNGKKKYKVNFKDGKAHGLWTYWHENGQKRSEINHKDGEYHGLHTKYDKNGKKVLEECLQNDNEVDMSYCL